MANQRHHAIKILQKVEEGAWITPLVEAYEQRAQNKASQGWMKERIFGVTRHRMRLDAQIDSLSKRPIQELDGFVRQALRLGLYEINVAANVPSYAAVSGVVQALKRLRYEKATGFVNAILRNALRGRGQDAETPTDANSLAIWGSHPQAWVERAVKRWGFEATRAIIEVNQKPAPLFFRLDVSDRQQVDPLVNRLKEEGVQVESIDHVPFAVRWRSGRWQDTPALREGLFWPQDLSSQVVGMLANVQPGETVLDLCAAPGGKSRDSIARGGSVLASDISKKRLALMQEVIAPFHASSIDFLQQDVLKPALKAKASFDVVLLDAPCSGTGNFRKKPESRYGFKVHSVLQQAERQLQMLHVASQWVKPRGRLIYAVCSLEPEEGSQVIAKFLEQTTDFEPLPTQSILTGLEDHCENGAFAPRPTEHGGEGFFAVSLRRR